MKFNKMALAIVAATAAPLAANAGVTVSPLLLGYHYTELEGTNDAQREILLTGRQLNTAKAGNTNVNNPVNGGVTKNSGLYTGAALGIELTPSTQFQVEYGVSNTEGQASEKSYDADEMNRFDVDQTMISGNFLVGLKNSGNFRPYALIGAGQSKIEVENQKAYTATSVSQSGKTGSLSAGTVVAESKDTIGNLGLGAMYRVNDALSLRGEARAIHNFDNNWWEGMALAGLEVVLGGHLGNAPVVPVAEPVIDVVPTQEADSDRDGVIDRLDACPGTPRNLVVDARGCPRSIEQSDDLNLELRVFFDNDKSAIKEQFRPEIAKVAQKMGEYPNSTARIEGHASKTGPSAAYNQRLSEARAVAVKTMLTNEYGVAPSRLSTQGFGYSKPIASNDTEEGRAMNRRVYAVITGNKTVTVQETK